MIQAFAGVAETVELKLRGNKSDGCHHHVISLEILANSGSKGAPFDAAIMESTTLEATSTSNLTLDTFNDVAQRSWCAPNATNLQSNVTLACLRSVPMETRLIPPRQRTTLRTFSKSTTML